MHDATVHIRTTRLPNAHTKTSDAVWGRLLITCLSGAQNTEANMNWHNIYSYKMSAWQWRWPEDRNCHTSFKRGCKYSVISGTSPKSQKTAMHIARKIKSVSPQATCSPIKLQICRWSGPSSFPWEVSNLQGTWTVSNSPRTYSEPTEHEIRMNYVSTQRTLPLLTITSMATAPRNRVPFVG